MYYLTGVWTELPNLTLVDSFVFATLIANVDPVATLSILGAIDADKMLYSIVFGESMLNDAVSVVLFHTLTNLRGPNLQLEPTPILKLVGLFVGMSVGSVAFGIAVGLVRHTRSTLLTPRCCHNPGNVAANSQLWLLLLFLLLVCRAVLCHVQIASFCFRHSALHLHPPIETILVVLFAYISYSVPEIIGLSGIMSLFFCGIILAHYNWYNLSEEARATTRHGCESMSFASETAVYIYLGLNFAFSFGRRTDSLRWNFHFLLTTLVLCFASRAVGIFVLSLGYNVLSKASRRIPLRMQVVMWWSGLRGSVAFALALNVPGPHTPTFVTTTLATVMFTTIVCGGLTEKVSNKQTHTNAN